MIPVAGPRPNTVYYRTTDKLDNSKHPRAKVAISALNVSPLSHRSEFCKQNVLHTSRTPHLAVTNTKLKAAAQGPTAARLSAPSRPTYPVSTRDKHGSTSTAPSVGSAKANISASKAWRSEAPTTAEWIFALARSLRLVCFVLSQAVTGGCMDAWMACSCREEGGGLEIGYISLYGIVVPP